MTWPWESEKVWRCLEHPAETDAQELLLHAAAHGLSAEEASFVADQMEGRAQARDKYPALLAQPRLLFPPRLNREQSSSQPTAQYKARLAARCLADAPQRPTMVDITGGFGIDDIFLAPLFSRLLHIERDAALSRLAAWNFRQLGLAQVETCCADSVEWLAHSEEHFDLLLADPARRDGNGRKTVGLDSCEPNLLPLLPLLFRHADRLLIKASPMIDLHSAMAQLGCVAEAHVVESRGECKEVLFLCRQGAAFLPREENISPTRGKNIFHAWEKKEPAEEGKGLPFEERKREPSAEGDKVSSAAGESVSSAAAPEPVISAVSLSADGVPASALSFTFGEEAGAEARYAAAIGRYLYEPDAALMKAGPYRSLCQWFDVSALARNSHLYTGERCLPSFPGRCWQVLREVRLNAKEMKTLLPGGRAHVVCRNYPVGAAQMQRQLHLQEGGELFVVATTWGQRKIGLLCQSLPPLSARYETKECR